MPLLSQNAFSWLSVHVSNSQSLTSPQAFCDLSSVSYHDPLTLDSRRSCVSSLTAWASWPLDCRYLRSWETSQFW